MVGEQSASYHAAHHYQRDFLHKFIFYVVYSSSFYSSLQIYDFFFHTCKSFLIKIEKMGKLSIESGEG